MELGHLLNTGLHKDPKTLHAITRDDPFSQVVKETLFDAHPVLRQPSINDSKFSDDGIVVINRPTELDGYEESDIKEYILSKVGG